MPRLRTRYRLMAAAMLGGLVLVLWLALDLPSPSDWLPTSSSSVYAHDAHGLPTFGNFCPGEVQASLVRLRRAYNGSREAPNPKNAPEPSGSRLRAIKAEVSRAYSSRWYVEDTWQLADYTLVWVSEGGVMDADPDTVAFSHSEGKLVCRF